MANVYYVYEHWRPDKNICFYVGKGKKNRAYIMKHRSDYHQKIINKLQNLGMCVEVRLFASGLNENEAFEIEKARISHWKNLGVNLSNRTNGGDGVSGLKHTEESRLLMSKQRKGHPPTRGTTGMKFSDETRAKMSASKKGKKPNNCGKEYTKKPFTQEALNNMSIAAKDRHKNNPMSAATKNKLSAATSAYWSRKRQGIQ